MLESSAPIKISNSNITVTPTNVSEWLKGHMVTSIANTYTQSNDYPFIWFEYDTITAPNSNYEFIYLQAPTITGTSGKYLCNGTNNEGTNKVCYP